MTNPLKKQDYNRLLDAWLSKHDVPCKDDLLEDEEKKGEAAAGGKRKLKDIKYQAVLDLHGKTKTESEAELVAFLRESYARGLIKVLIIHGKGYHSSGEPVIKKTVYNILESCSFTGQMGVPPREDGGSGAVWVILRQRSR